MHISQSRKQVYDLTSSDFVSSPAWDFCLDEEGEEDQDECTVRPFPVDSALDPAQGMFIVRARFTLADGEQFDGFLTPPVQGDSSLGTTQPVILSPNGQVGFWYGMLVPDEAAIRKTYADLGKQSQESVFPIQFESVAPIITGTVKGELQGLLVLEDFETGRFRVVR